MTITITEPTTLPAYCHYDGQHDPQGGILEIDPLERTVRITYDGTIGSGQPMDVYHGRILWIPVSPYLTREGASALLADVAPDAETIADGYRDQWDGSNWGGWLSDDARAALEAVRITCERSSDYETLTPLDPGDFFEPDSDEEIRAALADIPALVEHARSEGWLVDADALEAYRDEIEEEVEA